MHLEKRKTIKLFFLPDNKKIRQEEQQESTVLDLLSLLPNFCSGSSDANLFVSSPSINETFDLTSLIENSENRDVSRCLSRRLKFFQDF
jgi:hypothetical protein